MILHQKAVLLALLLLQLSAANAAVVHNTEISIQSVRSVMYMDTQISLFRHRDTPRRYFFQPLSFFDKKSIRQKGYQLFVPVYMWTNEFLTQLKGILLEAESIELMPLIKTRIEWSQHAAELLGDIFNSTWIRKENWKDGDKPFMQTAYTINCKSLNACSELHKILNETSKSPHLLDLKYRVNAPSQQNLTLIVSTDHLQKSEVYRDISSYCKKISQCGADREVVLQKKDIDAMANQLYLAALSDVSLHMPRDDNLIQDNALHKITDLLSKHPVNELSKHEWGTNFHWKAKCEHCRPDIVAEFLNATFKSSSRYDMVTVRRKYEDALTSFKHDVSTTAEKYITELFETIKRNSDVPVKRVEKLASNIGSKVSWNRKNLEFQPELPEPSFRLRLKDLTAHRIILTTNVTFKHTSTEHTDPIRPLKSDDEAAKMPWQPKFAKHFCFLVNHAEAVKEAKCNNVDFLVANGSRGGEGGEGGGDAGGGGGGGGRGGRPWNSGGRSTVLGMKLCCW